MKTSLSVLAITFALFAIPAAAQQGPAGVPGAPLIGAVIAPAPTPEEKRVQQQQAKRAAADCTQAKNPSQCKAQQAARKRARQACKDTQGPENKQCIRDFLAAKK